MNDQNNNGSRPVPWRVWVWTVTIFTLLMTILFGFQQAQASRIMQVETARQEILVQLSQIQADLKNLTVRLVELRADLKINR